MGGSPIADEPKITKGIPSEACELARTPSPTTPHTPPLRPMGTVGRRASPSALPSPHTLITPAPVLPPASLPPAPPMPLRGMEAHVFAACSRCAASLAPLATLGSSDAVGAAESGLCFGVRLRPAIHSPGGGAGAFTDSSKVRSRHTSLNSHVCRTLYTIPLLMRAVGRRRLTVWRFACAHRSCRGASQRRISSTSFCRAFCFPRLKRCVRV